MLNEVVNPIVLIDPLPSVPRRNLIGLIANEFSSRILGARPNGYGGILKACCPVIIHGVRLNGETHKFIFGA
jgi:hypothetical protein